MKSAFLAKWNTLGGRLCRLFDSRLYLVLTASLIFIAHTFAWEVPIAILLLLFTLGGFLFASDLRFLVPILLFCVCIIPVAHTPYLPTESDYYVTGWRPYLIAVGCVLLFLGFLVFILRNKKNAAPFSTLKLRYGFLAFFAALLLSGLFQENALKNFTYGLGVGASFLAVYLLFGFFHAKTKENAEHFLFALLLTGLLVSFELLVLYFRSVTFENGLPVKDSVMIGWGTWTHIGAMLSMCLPAPFYFAREAKKAHYPLYLLSAAVMTAALLFSASRAAWLYGGIIFVISALFLCLGGKNRKVSRVVGGIVCVLGVVFVLILLPKISAFLATFIKFGTGDNGRYDLWRAAVRAFLAAPIFGRGFFNSDIVLSFPPIMPYLYHNTLLQMLGAAGAVGLLLYLYHRFETVCLFLKKRKSILSLFLLLVPLALVLVSLTDEHLFHLYPAFFYAIAFSLAEGTYEDLPKIIEK